MALEEVFDDALVTTNFMIQTALSMDTVVEMGELCSELSKQYRLLGVCELLIDMDTDGFFHRLIDSGQTRKYFLQRCAQENELLVAARRASSTAPFFDALVANQFRLAEDIGRLAADHWFEGHEYKDDFAYARFLYGLIASGPDDELELKRSLDEFEQALEGIESVRLTIGEALLKQDEAAFGAAFSELLNLFAEEVNAEREFAYRFEDHQLVHIEALALLRLAERRGIRTEEEYRFCPSPARITDYKQYAPTVFPMMPLAG